MTFFQSLISNKGARKFNFLSDWKDLAEYIDSASIALPEESKAKITKAFNLKKLNMKGKVQNRLLKITANSLLNIEP